MLKLSGNVYECKSLPGIHPLGPLVPAAAVQQGLTLVQFPAHRKRIVWDRGCIEGVLRGCCGGV